MSDWKVSVSSSKGQAPQAVVATYTALISLELEKSSFRLNGDLAHDVLFEAISRPPEWPTATPWLAPRDSSNEELSKSALSKLLALLDFASQIEAATSEELSKAIEVRYPQIVKDRVLKSKGLLARKYKLFEMWAQILEDGSPTWGFDVPAAGTMLPGVLKTAGEQELGQLLTSGNASELDLFLQNSARTDLMERLSG